MERWYRTMIPDSEIYATIVALVLLICYGLMRRPASAEGARGRRLGDTVSDLEPASLRTIRLWHAHASPGPDSEELSGVRQGESPTEAPVVSGGTHLDEFADAFASAPATGRRVKSRRLECSPEHDRASDLSLYNDSTNVLLAERSSGVVRSRVAGAPTLIYRWVRPDEGKRLSAHGWWLEHVDPRYGTWLIRKEERWP